MRKVKTNRGPLKGAAFERHLCVRFSLWVSNGKRRDLFWRTAMSGGRATVALKRGEKIRQSGDMGSIAPEGHVLTDTYFFEFKHVNDIQFEAFVLKNKGSLAKWWTKTRRQAKQYNRTPVLIAKGNHMPTLVITPIVNMVNNQPVALLNGCVIGLLDSVLLSRPPQGI